MNPKFQHQKEYSIECIKLLGPETSIFSQYKLSSVSSQHYFIVGKNTYSIHIHTKARTFALKKSKCEKSLKAKFTFNHLSSDSK